jgi:hypothetical protein
MALILLSFPLPWPARVRPPDFMIGLLKRFGHRMGACPSLAAAIVNKVRMR